MSAPPRAALDLLAPEAVRRAVREAAPALVVHAAAYTDPVRAQQEAERCRAINAGGTAAVARGAAEAGARLVLISTCHVYGPPEVLPVPEEHPLRPRGVYAVSKAEAEGAARAVPELDLVVVRPFNLTGPGQGRAAAPSDWALRAAQGAPEILVGDLSAERDYLDVRDAAAGIALLARSGRSGWSYNLATGVAIPMRRILELAAPGVPARQDPARLRPSTVPVLIGDAGRARALGWAPTIPLERSLRELRAWHAARC